jgi:hypothetical protein
MHDWTNVDRDGLDAHLAGDGGEGYSSDTDRNEAQKRVAQRATAGCPRVLPPQPAECIANTIDPGDTPPTGSHDRFPRGDGRTP